MLLAGPVLAVLTAFLSLAIGLTSAFLPFALVGLLVWLPYHLFAKGPHQTWERLRAAWAGILASPLAMPFRFFGNFWVRSREVGQAALEFNRSVFRFLGYFLVEALSGSLIGLLVALMTGTEPLQGEHVALCIGVGACIGGAVGIARYRPTQAENFEGEPSVRLS